MAITNFIPAIWSETLAKELDKEYIAVRNCNRDFEGEIRKAGDKVYINSIGNINVFTYTKDTDMSAPQNLDSTRRTLNITEVKAFNFQIDDVDKAQSQPKIMQAAMREAANALADTADKYVYNLYSEALESNIISKDTFTYSDVVDTLIQAREKLLSNNVNSNTETVLEVSPAVGAQILKAKILQSSDNEEVLENGYIGSFIGFKVYISNNIVKAGTGHYKCFARTKRAIAFAEQLNEVEAYRPEKRFADAVKGLHLYGAGLIYPSELVVLNIKV